MPPDSTRPNMAVIDERLRVLIDAVTEIKTAVHCVDDRLDIFERQYIERHTALVSKVDTTKLKCDDHEDRIQALEKAIQGITPWMKLLAFVGSGLGVSIIALIWALLTGQATVMFP